MKILIQGLHEENLEYYARKIADLVSDAGRQYQFNWTSKPPKNMPDNVVEIIVNTRGK